MPVLERHAGPQAAFLTVSIGAAVYQEDGCTAQKFLEVTDRPLYADKRKSVGDQFQTAIAE